MMFNPMYLQLPLGGGWEPVVGPPGFKFEYTPIGTILTSLMDYVFVIAGILLLFMIIASGYTLMTSAGNPEAISKGKSHLTAALVGFLLVFAAFWILQIIEVFLGVQGTPFGFT